MAAWTKTCVCTPGAPGTITGNTTGATATCSKCSTPAASLNVIGRDQIVAAGGVSPWT